MPHERRHYRRVPAAVVALVLASLSAVVAGGGPVGAQSDEEADPVQWQSDGFDTANLGTAGWTFVSPAGRGLATIENSTLLLRASGDLSADSWRRHDSLHLTRPAPDRNMVMRTTFGTVPNIAYEAQGIVFANNEFDFLRIDVIGDLDGESRRLYAASSIESLPVVHANVPIEVTVPFDVQIRRDGDLWTVYVINAAGEVTLGASFVRPLTVRSYGPFATSREARGQASFIGIDILEGGGDPVIPMAIDKIRPLLQGAVADNLEEGVAISWTTDELTTGRVVATTLAGETVEIFTALDHDHRALLDTSITNEVYTFEIEATDTSGNTSTDSVTNHTYAHPDLPIIEIYGGRDRIFGFTGDPQPTASITGLVRSPSGEFAVFWRLDGGAWEELIPNPASTRVINDGEFSIELPQSSISSVSTLMDIEAREIASTEIVTAEDETQTIVREFGATNSVSLDLQLLRPLDIGPDRTVSWNDEDLDRHGQIANGGWQLVPGGVAPLQVGPHRIILIGDQSWSNYEVELTILAGEAVPALEAEPVLAWAGVYLGWRGFDPVSEASNEVLRTAGAAGFGHGDGGVTVAGVRNESDFIANTGPVEIISGRRYRLIARAETVQEGAEVRMKLWLDGEPEPAEWTIEHINVGAPFGGSVALVAHRWDVVFGPVTIRPL